jgi:hypothetical protein
MQTMFPQNFLLTKFPLSSAALTVRPLLNANPLILALAFLKAITRSASMQWIMRVTKAMSYPLLGIWI